MRKIFAFFTVALLWLVACEPIINGDDMNTPGGGTTVVTDHLSVTTESIIRMAAVGGTAEVGYTIAEPIEGVELVAEADVDWIECEKCAEVVKLTVAPNEESSQRVGVITLTYGQESLDVFVEQSGSTTQSDARLELVSDRKMNFVSTGGDGEILYNLESSEENAVVKVAVDAEWISDIVVEAERVGFVVAKNLSTEQRTTRITLSYETLSLIVTILQEGVSNELVLSANKKVVKVGEVVEFVATQANEDVTAEAKYFDYYTKSEVSNPYTATAEGDCVFYATYKGATSKVLTINVLPANAPDFPEDGDPENYTFKHRMLLIDHTGTDCGYCPNMMESLKTLSEDATYNDTYNIAIAHSYNTSDAAYSTVSKTLYYFFNRTNKVLTGYPTLTYNYWYKDSAGSSLNFVYSHLQKNILDSQSVAAAVSTELSGNDVLVSVALKSERDRTYRINLFLLEDNIYSYQYGASQSWMHYHNNAIRASYFTLDYTDISGGEWGYVGAKSTSYKVFSIPTESSWVKSNLKVLVVLAAQDSNGKFDVVNTTVCPINGSVPFDYK